MAKIGTSNGATNSGSVMMGQHVTNMLSAGWTIPSYGTGLDGTYSASGAGWSIASLNSGRDQAWVRVRDPAGRREETFQMQNSGGLTNLIRRKVSALQKFSGGSPSAGVTPSAIDELIIAGYGTDAAPSWDQLCNVGGAVQVRYHSVCENVPVSGVYMHSLVGQRLGSVDFSHWLLTDAMAAGTHDVNDVDPATYMFWSTTVNRICFWAGYGKAGVSARAMAVVTNQLAFGGALLPHPGSTNNVGGRALVYDASYYKGLSTWYLLKGQGLAYPNVLNRDTDCRIYYGTTGAGVMPPGMNGVNPVM
jgi:hypothetical protein